MQELTLSQAKDFFDKDLPTLMGALQPALPPVWGQMTPQHAVEHLAWTVGASVGKVPFDVVTPADKLPKYRLFVYSNLAISLNFKMPILDPVRLPDLTTPSLAGAIAYFWEEWAGFQAYFEQNPTAMTNHIVFGPLSRDEWWRFHFKHVVHHLSQFGVTSLDEHGLVLLPPRL